MNYFLLFSFALFMGQKASGELDSAKNKIVADCGSCVDDVSGCDPLCYCDVSSGFPVCLQKGSCGEVCITPGDVGRECLPDCPRCEFDFTCSKIPCLQSCESNIQCIEDCPECSGDENGQSKICTECGTCQAGCLFGCGCPEGIVKTLATVNHCLSINCDTPCAQNTECESKFGDCKTCIKGICQESKCNGACNDNEDADCPSGCPCLKNICTPVNEVDCGEQCGLFKGIVETCKTGSGCQCKTDECGISICRTVLPCDATGCGAPNTVCADTCFCKKDRCGNSKCIQKFQCGEMCQTVGSKIECLDDCICDKDKYHKKICKAPGGNGNQGESEENPGSEEDPDSEQILRPI